MSRVVSLGNALTLKLKTMQVVYLSQGQELENFLKAETCEAILLNHFADSEAMYQKLTADFPFFRFFRIEQALTIEATLEEATQREKLSIERRLDSLNQLSDGQLTIELVSLFIDKFHFYRLELERVLRAQNANELCFYSHNLKSSSANLGALRLSQVCQHIESTSNERNFEKLQIYVNLVLHEYVKSIKYLQKFVKPVL